MRKIKHGFLGRVIYEKEEFKEVPPSTEERRKQLQEKLKPWTFDPNKPLFAAGKGEGDTPTPSPSPTPTPSATPFPTPTPSPIIYTASITPSSSVQYENVVLTGSTNLTNPVFVWSLTDFYDTSGNTISTYTGQTLQEGYFTSTGSSSVELNVVGEDTYGNTFTASTTDFVVGEFNPSLLSSSEVWLDLSDSGSIQTREDAGTTYITSIENKAANNYMTGFTNSVGAEQWIYDTSSYYTASTRSVGISTINEASYLSNTYWTGYTKEIYIIHRIESQVGSSTLPLFGRRNDTERFGLVRRKSNSSAGFQIYANVPTSDYLTLYQENYGVEDSELGAYNQVEFIHQAFNGTDTAVWYDTLSGNTSGVSANIEYNFTAYTGSFDTDNTRVVNTNPDNNEPFEVYNGLDGEIWEVVVFNELLTEEKRLQINRYFYYKWDLANYAEMGVPYSIPLVDKGN